MADSDEDTPKIEGEGMIFSLYEGGGISNVYPSKNISVEIFRDLIASDTYRFAIERIRSSPKEEQTRLKRDLDYATPGGVFTQRAKENLIASSGYASIDVDKLKDSLELEQVRTILKKDPYIRLMFVSPSGMGLKIIITIPFDSKNYEKYTMAYYNYLLKTYHIQGDTVTRDISRACFVSYDPSPYFNKDSINFTADIIVEKPSYDAEDEVTFESLKVDYKYTPESIIKILSFVNIKGYPDWITVLMGVKTHGFETKQDLFEIIDEWSKKQPDYKDTEDVRKAWNGIKERRGDSITIATVIDMAKKNGCQLKTIRKEQEAKHMKQEEELRLSTINDNTPDELLKNAIFFYKKGNAKIANQIMARYILKKFHLLYDEENNILKVYTARNFYEEFGEGEIKTEISLQIGHFSTNTTKSEIINKVKDFVIKTNKIKEIPLNLLPFKNGVLDLNTMTLNSHKPEDYFEYQVGFNYILDADCPVFNRFITDVCEIGSLSLIYDLGGMALYRENYLEKFFILTGEGQNGKSTFTEFLEYVIGTENKSAVPLSQIIEDRFAMARTYKKLINVATDISANTIKDASIIRAMSSRDSISAQFKFGKLFDFKPSALLIFGANTLPIFHEDVIGNYRRIETIKFPNNYGNSEDLKRHPDWKAADPELRKKLQCEKEAEGFIRYSIEALKRILKTKALSVVHATDDLKMRYIRGSNSLKYFMGECCIEENYIPSYVGTPAENYILMKDFFDEYRHFCNINKLQLFSQHKIGRLIKSREMDWGITPGYERVGGVQYNSYRGLKWKPGFPKYVIEEKEVAFTAFLTKEEERDATIPEFDDDTDDTRVTGV